MAKKSASIRRGPQPDTNSQINRTSIAGEPVGLMLCGGLSLVLLLMRFFCVAESADRGETLWIVSFWMVALFVWVVVSWKSSFPITPSGWFGIGVALLAIGHVVSSLIVVITIGDKRAAINLAWEWIGVATGWFLLRQQCQFVAFRQELLAGLIAAGASIAGLGLYQHYVEFPAMAAKYGPLFDRLKVADPVEASAIRKELVKEEIPVEGPAFTLFEKRLRDSREPNGFFGLANNLGGFLSVCLILSVSVSASHWQSSDREKWGRLVFWMTILLLLSWCLLLTKSRTAWIGTVVGLCLQVLLTRNIKLKGMSWRLVLGVMVLLGLAGWGLGRVGGLDKQVLTEAPKSLQYRLQYWSATLPMIRDHLVFGVGPGQFRWNYLFYKLPEASEEISDPHNLLLDVAANAGLVAVLGLLIIVLFLSKTAVDLGDVPKPSESSGRPIVLYLVLSFIGMAWTIYLFTGADDRLLFLLPLVATLFWFIRRGLLLDCANSPGIAFGWVSASFSLLVHLCGAGGIGMPTICLLLMALIAAADGSRPDWAKSSGNLKFRNAAILGTISFGLFVALFVTGIQPVAIVNKKLSAGDQLVQRGMPDAAEREYIAAEAADRWSAEATRRRAELAYRRAQSDQFHSNDSFQTAVGLMREIKLRDPTSFRDDVRLGAWWIERWYSTKDARDAAEAVEAYERVLARYPTNASIMAELAFARDSAGFVDAAKDVARQSLRQDAINHERGHLDRYLTHQVRIRLESLLNSPHEEKQGI